MKIAVTGAYGYSGKYIAQRLLAQGHTVITLTNSLNREHPFGDAVPAFPFNFDNPEALAQSLHGVDVLINTYWVRFNHKLFTHADAVANTITLFEAAQQAGVERVVHFSITNPSLDSPLEYFSGKAVLEKALQESNLSYAILRPTVLFGREDILINNIAWVLRHFPVFGVFGNGAYRLQPMHVDDMAALAVGQAAENKNVIIDAIGPETFAYRDLVADIGRLIGKERPIVSIPPWAGYAVGACIGRLMQDVFITKAEIEGLMADLLYVESPPAGNTRLTEWVQCNADTLGRRYASELARRRNRDKAYVFT